MKFEIMLGILFDLMSKKNVTARYLAEKYEVSVRSIYRYIKSIEYAGIPIFTNRGNGGGFQIVDTFKFSSMFFTVNELEQTISTLSAITDSVPNKVINSVINKLKGTKRNEFSGFEIKSGNLIIDGGPWGDTVGYKSKLKVLQECIESDIKLLIKYHDRNGIVSERIINPHVLVLKQGLWYVFAYCNLRNEFRFFKTGRIEYAQKLPEKFVRQDLTKMDLPLDFWHNSVNSEPIIMEIGDKILSDVEEWVGIENIKRINEKNIAEVNLPYDNGLMSKIISFGSSIKVLSPKKLVGDIKASASEIVKLYTK